jgi:cellulose synthase/poly-beta-1,6-N-acetylglucosamine synthase-like glycosyltransferase
MSALYGLYFVYGCRFESRGRTVMGCSTRVQGTGYVINSNIVKDGWPYVTLTEDWEFTADRILLDEKIRFCDEAVFYDEQPTKVKVMVRQRLRWAKGHLLVCVTRFSDMIRGIFKPRSKGGIRNKGSMFDFFVNSLPVCVIATAISVLQFIAILFSPLFGHNLIEVLWGSFLSSLPAAIASYLFIAALSFLIYIIEARRIKNVSLFIKIVSALIWPAFLLLATPIEVVALFWRNLQWKEIPHTNTTDFATLNEDETDISEGTPETETV